MFKYFSLHSCDLFLASNVTTENSEINISHFVLWRSHLSVSFLNFLHIVDVFKVHYNVYASEFFFIHPPFTLGMLSIWFIQPCFSSGKLCIVISSNNFLSIQFFLSFVSLYLDFDIY